MVYSGALNLSLILFSALSFLGYGAACLFSTRMKQEFERYRLGSQRLLVGALQLVAATGLLAGFSQPWLGRSAAAGLALMMLVAVSVRIQIKDTLLQMTPGPALSGTKCLPVFGGILTDAVAAAAAQWRRTWRARPRKPALL
jgi:uncharacterized membrane protein YkgB